MPTVSALMYYPVKGLAGVAVERTEVTSMGLRHDRTFMLVEAGDGSFISQRKVPAMAVVRAVPHEGGLLLSADGMPDTWIETALDGPRRQVSLFKSWFGEAVDQGDAAAEWFSQALKWDVRLVRVSPDHDRDGWGRHPGKVGFADAHAILVTSRSSLDDLNERIRATGAPPIPMDRFRPNIVVEGWTEPYTEDRVDILTVGSVELGFSVQAMRCSVTTVDQSRGEKAGPEPLRTLATYRKEPEYNDHVSFGAKLAVLREGVIAVGDEVREGR